MKDGLTARMVRSAAFLLVLIGSGPAARLMGQEGPPPSSPPAQSPLPAQPGQRIGVEVNLVTVRFTVRDDQGVLLNQIPKEDFRVFENGKQQDIAFFDGPRNPTGEASPILLAFLLDVSGSTFATRSEEIIAAQTFFDNILRVTQVGIFGFTDKLIVFQDFTSDRGLALKAFGEARQHLGRTAIYDSLDTLIDRLNKRAKPTDRKVVILVSDAVDEHYRNSTRVLKKANENRVNVYTVLVPSAAQLYIGSADSPPEGRGQDSQKAEREEAFARLATSTGAKTFSGFETILDFDQTLAQISDDVYGNLYSVGYYTEDPYLTKAEREISVQVRRLEAHVSALFKTVPERLTEKKKFIAALFDAQALTRLSESSLARFDEIGAELDLLPSTGEGGQIGLPFRVKISPFSLAGLTKSGVKSQFGVIGILLDERGREVVRLREFFRVSLSTRELREGRGIMYSNKLIAPPGRYEFKLALLELSSWKVSSFDNDVTIAIPQSQ